MLHRMKALYTNLVYQLTILTNLYTNWTRANHKSMGWLISFDNGIAHERSVFKVFISERTDSRSSSLNSCELRKTSRTLEHVYIIKLSHHFNSSAHWWIEISRRPTWLFVVLLYSHDEPRQAMCATSEPVPSYSKTYQFHMM